MTETDRHGESYIDSEGEERCTTCEKWLEPGYYTIEDHQRAERPTGRGKEWL